MDSEKQKPASMRSSKYACQGIPVNMKFFFTFFTYTSFSRLFDLRKGILTFPKVC